jgi:hypothetical protein
MRIAGDMCLHQPNPLERPTQSQMREYRNKLVNWAKDIAEIAREIQKASAEEAESK